MSDKILTNMQEKTIDDLEAELIVMTHGISIDTIRNKACELVRYSAMYNEGPSAIEVHQQLIAKGFDFKEALLNAESEGEYFRAQSRGGE